jgi:hypothetical protein
MTLSALKRWWNSVLSALPRALAGRLTKDLPRLTHDGIELVFFDASQTHMAEQYFERAISALRLAAAADAKAYAELKGDVKRIIFWKSDTGLPYHQFQQAIIVPPEVAQEADPNCFAAWLLHVSGMSEQSVSSERSAMFLKSLPPDEAARVSQWLTDTMQRSQLARESYRPEDDASNESCPL